VKCPFLLGDMGVRISTANSGFIGGIMQIREIVRCVRYERGVLSRKVNEANGNS